MSEMTSGAATGGQIGPADAATGGTPNEADLPSLQGLGDSVDDPSDPGAARADEDTADDVPLAARMNGDESKGASDPMPDVSGTSGS